jgi:signal transduction histidine kinase
LTVIRNEARSMPGEQGQLILDQSHVMANSIGHYLSMARVHGQKNPFGIRTDVEATVDDLRFVVEHVYREKNLDVELSRLQDCWFRGESQDLEEMAGNLLDNACKWAEKRVEVHAEMKGDRLLLVVEDDGPGIPPEKRDEVTERGSRLDQSKPGDGQGLGIVNDVSALYGGTLTLDKSHLGGLKAVLDLPAA